MESLQEVNTSFQQWVRLSWVNTSFQQCVSIFGFVDRGCTPFLGKMFDLYIEDYTQGITHCVSKAI